MMDLSYAVKLLDVDDEVRAGAAGVVVDRHLLTGRVSEAVDAQIAELRDEVRKLGHSLERGLGIAQGAVRSFSVSVTPLRVMLALSGSRFCALATDLAEVLRNISVALAADDVLHGLALERISKLGRSLGLDAIGGIELQAVEQIDLLLILRLFSRAVIRIEDTSIAAAYYSAFRQALPCPRP